MRIIFVVGARPNFIKAAPLIREAEKRGVEYVLIHTGQHYDHEMSEIFFEGMGIPEPDLNLEKDKTSSFESLGRVMDLFQTCVSELSPDLVVVIGDVDSTMGCALATVKSRCKLAHVEAGERSLNMSMPEEVNRIITDRISDFLFCSSHHAVKNLEKEGLKGIVAGNVIADNIFHYIGKIKERKNKYALITIHRQSNVDDRDNLRNILEIIQTISEKIKVVFPMHPRTAARIEKFGLNEYIEDIKIENPMGYLEFISSMKNSSLLITDSGGCQIEASILNVPCITLRDETEWIDSIKLGTNILAGTKEKDVMTHVDNILQGNRKYYNFDNTLWDGNASVRIFNLLEKI